ncbi:hypothetical protein [Nocardia heshunensis]
MRVEPHAPDSVGCAELIAELETTFGVRVTKNDIPTTRTLREVWEAMERNLRDA